MKDILILFYNVIKAGLFYIYGAVFGIT